ncbi:hypothetical protein [Treponema denticola]|uniref:hypothetical protein n=1 Tax=Treponema denticola TaxID=158 RepID=UPI002101F1A7|nr:hypothetical protein [Treponema denticola]UTY25735.1 hypothetical protein E4N77_02880 [Treponema denticola]
MKKISIFFFCMMMVSANIFAQSDLQGNGNGGKDKLGAWVGFPFIGLSYSHEFNDLMELDLLAGLTGVPFIVRNLNIRTGLLFTVWEPVINGQKCPITIGSAVDINIGLIAKPTAPEFTLYKPTNIGVKILCPIRWEVNFQSAPSFNLFIEAAPAIGFSYYFSDMSGTTNGLLQKWINNRMAIEFIPHIGLGLRYRIPNK